MTSQVIYLGDLRTESTHIKSGEKYFTDAPVDNHGKGEAFSPTDLMTTSLANCMITIMGIAANNHEINIDGARADVTKYMGLDPRRVSQIDITITMPNKTYSNKEKKIIEKAGLTCPVSYSLHPDLVQNIEFIWPD
jgi:putative redox protein